MSKNKLAQIQELTAKVMTPEMVGRLTSTQTSADHPAHIVCDWETPAPIVFVTEVRLDFERRLAAEAQAGFERCMTRYPEIKSKLFDAATQEEALREAVSKSLLVGRKLMASDSDLTVYVLGAKPPFKNETELEQSCLYAPLAPYLHEMLGYGFIFPLTWKYDNKRSCNLSEEKPAWKDYIKRLDAFERRKDRHQEKSMERADDAGDMELGDAIHAGIWATLRLLEERENKA